MLWKSGIVIVFALEDLLLSNFAGLLRKPSMEWGSELSIIAL